LHEKLNLINGSPFKKQKDLAAEYGISIGSVSNMLKRRLDYEAMGEKNANPNAKRLKQSTTEDLNTMLYQWFETKQFTYLRLKRS
jgi:hypothetical protein